MRNAVGFLCGVVAVALLAVAMEAGAHHDGTYLEYWEANGYTGATAEEVCENNAAYLRSVSYDRYCVAGSVVYSAQTPGGHETGASYTLSAEPEGAGTTWNYYATPIYTEGTPPEPEPDWCSDNAGTEVTFTVPNTASSPYDFTGCECSAADSYGVSIIGDDGRAVSCTITGDETTAGSSSENTGTPSDSEEQCVTGQSGRTICGNPDEGKENCGSYNGTPYCVTPDDTPQCLTGSNGTVLCQSDGTDYPPDAPTEDFGGPKPPADEWEHVDESGGQRPMGGWPDGDGSTGGGAGGESGGSSGSGGTGETDLEGDTNGDGICDPNVEECGEGEGPNLDEVCPDGVDCDAGSGMSDLLNTIQTQGIVAEATGLSLPSGGAACPPLAFDTELTGALSTDVHCTIAAEQSSLISGAMRAVWVIAALFVLLSG